MKRILRKSAILPAAFAVITLITFSYVQSQSSLQIAEMWHYGRGVIQNFHWDEQQLIVATTHDNWQINPTGNEEPTISELGSFQLSTSPDGAHFVIYESGNYFLWDAQTNTLVTTIRSEGYGESDAIGWQPNGNLLATIGYAENDTSNGTYSVALWNTITGERTATIGAYSELIVALSWHPSEDMLAVRQSNGRIIIVDPRSGEEIRELIADATNTATIAWSPDGSKLAATSNGEASVKIWRTHTFEEIRTSNQPIFNTSLSWNSDSTRLAGSLLGSGVGIWNVETDEVVSLGYEPDIVTDSNVEQIAWHNNLLAALDRTQRLRVWDISEIELVWDSSEYGFHSEMQDIAVSRNGLVAVAYHNNTKIDILNGADGALIQTLEVSAPLNISDTAWSPSNEQLAVASTNLFIWSFQTNIPTQLIHVDDVTNLSWSPDRVLAVSSVYQRSDELRFLSSDGEQLETQEVLGLAFPLWSPDGRFIALYRYNSPTENLTTPPTQIDILNIQQNTITTISMPVSNTSQVTPSENFLWLPDSTGLIGFADDGSLWQWDVDTNLTKIIVSEPQVDTTNQSFPLAINANGEWLAVSNLTTNGQVYILDAASGELLPTTEEIAVTRYPFAWGGENMLFVYDGVLHAYQVSPR
jgi:WD40 repeat protein